MFFVVALAGLKPEHTRMLEDVAPGHTEYGDCGDEYREDHPSEIRCRNRLGIDPSVLESLCDPAVGNFWFKRVGD